MITEQILPTLPKITSKEPGLLMAILGIYKLAFENSNIGVSREQLAKSALPFLISSSIENTLNLGQFEQYISVIKAMLEKVETEQRSRLQQLSAGQEEQRGVPNFDAVLKPINTSIPQSLDGVLQGLDIGGTPATGNKQTGVLTLEDKKRMAAERENQVKGGAPVAATAKPTLSQLSSAPDFGVFGGQAVSKPAAQARAVTPLDALFGPSPSVTNSKATGGAVDVSDFLPTGGKKEPFRPITLTDIFGAKPATSTIQPSAGFNFPTNSQFSMGNTTSSTNQFSTAPMSGLNSLGGFAPPPSSSNRAVQRPAANSLDTLFSFPTQQKPTMGSLNGGMTPTRPQQQQPPKKDPFADLLG